MLGKNCSLVIRFRARRVHRTNRRAIVRPSVCLSVCLSETGVHCDHTVHFSADLPSVADPGRGRGAMAPPLAT